MSYKILYSHLVIYNRIIFKVNSKFEKKQIQCKCNRASVFHLMYTPVQWYQKHRLILLNIANEKSSGDIKWEHFFRAKPIKINLNTHAHSCPLIETRALDLW